MKIKFILLIVAFATIISCNKNEVQKTTDKDIAKSSYVTKSLVASEEMLSFSSDKEMYETAAMLSEMSKNDLNTWYNSKNSNFKSIEQIYREAINEFEEFGNLEIPDFKVAEEIKDKYRDILLFNNNPKDEELYAPLLPISNPFYSYVCNKNGDVLVNGVVNNLKDIERFEDTRYYQTSLSFMTKTVEQDKDNYIWILDGKRKMWVDVIGVAPHGAYYYPYCALKMEARKKNWLGWFSYATVYELWIVQDLANYDNNATFPEFRDLRANKYLNTGEIGSGNTFRIAQYITPTTKITGKIRMSSRGTGGQSAVLKVNHSYR